MSPKITIVSLPVELLQDIFLLSHSLPALRLVCKLFSDVVVSELFSHICISYQVGKLDIFLEALEALIIGAHPAAVHTKSITIKNITPSLEPERDRLYYADPKKYQLRHQQEVLNPYNVHLDFIQTWFPAALSGLKNTATVTWTADDCDSYTWSRDCVLSGITRMQSLKELVLYADLRRTSLIDLRTLPPLEQLIIKGQPGTTVGEHGSIRGIHELIAKSARSLKRLDIQASEISSKGGPAPFLPSYLQDAQPMHLLHLSLMGFSVPFSCDAIPHFRFLKSLCLMQVYRKKFNRSKNNSILSPPVIDPWKTLRQANILLRDIAIDWPSNAFSEYLKSYSGLKSLTITGASGASAHESDEHAIYFFAGSLRTHSNTLEILKITPAYEGKWCFGEHSARAISTLPRLKQLSVSIIADSTRTVPSLSWPGHHKDKEIQPEMKFNPLYPVCNLMRTASLLPNLNLLAIHGARLTSNRNVRCGNGLRSLEIPAPQQIHIHVTSFGPLEPSEYKFVIANNGKEYTLQRREEGAEYWYSAITSAV